MSQLHPPPRPAPSRPADWPVHTHSLLCLHCDVPTKDMHLLSCIAKGLPPRHLSTPKLQLPVCGLADPSTGAICLGGAVASTGSPLRPPPAFLSATLGPSGLVPWGALVRPYLLGDGLTVSRGLRKARCARLSHPDFHPDTTVGRGPSPAHGGVRTCLPPSTLEPSEYLLSSNIVPRRTPALDQGLAFQVRPWLGG